MFRSLLTFFRCVHIKSQIRVYYAFAEYVIKMDTYLVKFPNWCCKTCEIRFIKL
jgi:hypothetical protein